MSDPKISQNDAEIDAINANLGSCDVADRYEEERPCCMINRHTVNQLKMLNASILPVDYPEKFYEGVLTAGEMAKLAYLNDLVVGGVCCKVDGANGRKCIYIMTLGTLAPYRRYGIGTFLLEHVFYLCRKDPSIKVVRLHVQINNPIALEFYQKFGFHVVGLEEKYYKDVEPDSAFRLEKVVN
uniref:N-terminal methionine N(alpha)-acetyltransferase NatE n=1 Tax=Ditylenchus dipsaci TaxID=166011 RepID=A0A915EPF5_9BILA